MSFAIISNLNVAFFEFFKCIFKSTTPKTYSSTYDAYQAVMYVQSTSYSQALYLGGNSEHVAHAWRKRGILKNKSPICS